MKPKKDLTGQVFGQLKVVSLNTTYAQEHNLKGSRSYWNCICSCGNNYTVLGSNLTTGHTTKCLSCAHKLQDLTGKKFNNWTVISQNKEYRINAQLKNTHRYWNCRCDCGNYGVVKGSDLITGASKRCGKCANNLWIDERGNRYGNLTIIEYLRYQDRKSIWLAKCDCGNTCEVSPCELRRGKQKMHCGCKKIYSYGEQKIENILQQNNIKYVYQKSFEDLKGKQNISLLYDFAILDSSNTTIRLIEFDGAQHIKEVAYFGNNLQRIQELDKIKNKYALKHQIPLVRIPYTQLQHITYDMIMGDNFLVKE